MGSRATRKLPFKFFYHHRGQKEEFSIYVHATIEQAAKNRFKREHSTWVVNRVVTPKLRF